MQARVESKEKLNIEVRERKILVQRERKRSKRSNFVDL